MQKRMTAVFMAGVMGLSALSATGYHAVAESVSINDENNNLADTTTETNNILSYAAYLASLSSLQTGVSEIVLPGDKPDTMTDTVRSQTDYRQTGKNCVVIPDNGSATWQFHVPQDGFYELMVTYMPGEAAGGNVEVGLALDGKTPFREVSLVSFRRTYQQSAQITANVAGNDIKPQVTEIFRWKESAVQDTSGYQQLPFRFGMTKGTHTLTLSGSRGVLAVQTIRLIPSAQTVNYAAYLNQHQQNGHKAANGSGVVFEAEHLTEKSAMTIVPVSDHSSAATTPQDIAALRLNTVGGDNWKQVGDSITWIFTVKQDGMYQIAPRFRQNVLDGIFTSRKLLLDGQLPFAEAAALRFSYSSDWQLQPLGNGKQTFSFYLTAGTHTITLEAVMGDVAQMVGQIKESLNALNAVYRRIIMVTGSSPDTYRDYHFDTLIPDEISALGEQRDLLQKAVNEIDQAAGGNGSYTSILKKIIFQLDKMNQTPSTIAKYLTQFKSNLGSLGSWLLTASQQPLQIDKFYVQPEGEKLPDVGVGFFQSLSFSVGSFAATFYTDYSAIGQSVGTAGSRQLKVWTQTGRDQAEVLRGLIDTTFAKDQNVSVNLELVAGGTLLQSVLAGMAPDVALNNAISEPINYAVRNANVDLTKFSDFHEVAGWFHPAAIAPYTYQGKVYALPETFTFPMFFYRTDIFKELGLSVPTCWDDLVELIPVLQRKNLTMGLPHDANMYALLLYQNGGTLYQNEGERTNLSTNVGLNTFLELTELFTLYNLPVTFDFSNRFRSGEMPCGIQDYSVYNQLTAFAPEIKGLWQMIPVPGKKAGETLSVGTGANAMLIAGSKNEDLAWEFLKWWMSSQVQSTFAVQMESILGPAAKQPTANLQALTNMTWSSTEQAGLRAQLQNVRAVPEVPGGYYLSRIITFAFNRVYNSAGEQTMAENPVEVIGEYMDELNDELQRKRAEFGIR